MFLPNMHLATSTKPDLTRGLTNGSPFRVKVSRLHLPAPSRRHPCSADCITIIAPRREGGRATRGATTRLGSSCVVTPARREPQRRREDDEAEHRVPRRLDEHGDLRRIVRIERAGRATSATAAPECPVGLGSTRRSAARRGRLALRAPSGMTIGMTTSKIAVSLPSELVDKARRAVARHRAESVSAYVASAVAEKAKLDELNELLQEMLAETGGPLTAAERRAADEALGLPRRRRGRAA